MVLLDKTLHHKAKLLVALEIRICNVPKALAEGLISSWWHYFGRSWKLCLVQSCWRKQVTWDMPLRGSVSSPDPCCLSWHTDFVLLHIPTTGPQHWSQLTTDWTSELFILLHCFSQILFTVMKKTWLSIVVHKTVNWKFISVSNKK